jgi:hypothetical protein
LWQDGALVDGIDEWWDDVELALTNVDGDYPLLDGVDPYGDLTLPRDRLDDLARECRDLAGRSQPNASALLLKLADLCDRAIARPGTFLQFNGD